MRLPFRDRHHAGAALATLLERYRDDPEVLVLALPRGGVPVGFEVARHLHRPLDLFLVRKLGVPGHEELAFGAIASGGIRVISESLVRAVGVPRHMIEAVTTRERNELERREQAYRPGQPPLDVNGKTVIVVDDGLATGSTMLAAVRALRAMHASRIVVAVPVASEEACRLIAAEADEAVCGATPCDFRAVGQWYDDFNQTTDDEVRKLLEQHDAAFR